MDQGEVLRQQVVADDARHVGAVRLGELPGGILQLLRTHVARGRVDEVAAEPDRLDLGQRARGIDAARDLQLRAVVVAAGRFVAAEAVGAEPPGDGRKLGLGKVVGQVIAAGRQQAGSRPTASSGLSMGSPLRSSPRPSTAPASAPSGPGSSTCLRAAPLKPCASSQVRCALGQSRLANPLGVAGQPDRDRFLLGVMRHQHGGRYRRLLRLVFCCHGGFRQRG